VTGLSELAGRLRESLIQQLFTEFREDPDVISFAAGAPDERLLPVEVLDAIIAETAAGYGRRILQYGPVQGFAPLIEALLPVLHRRGVKVGADEVHVTTGATGALFAVCAAVLDPGDRVLVSDPSYGAGTGFFSVFGADVVGVPSDREGMLPDALDRELRRAPTKLIYLMPTYQNPTGANMSSQRRADLAGVVARHGTLVVEDDAYCELWYRAEPAAALYAHVPEQTVYIGSLSKSVAPALRLGYATMPAELLGKVMQIKQFLDMQTSVLTQAVAARFLARHFAEHTDRLRREYGRRLAATCSALHAAGLDDFSWDQPDGGMFLWLRGPRGFRVDRDLLRSAAAAGVLFVPGSQFHVDPEAGLGTLRLCFASCDPDRIAEGIARLASVLRAARRGDP